MRTKLTRLLKRLVRRRRTRFKKAGSELGYRERLLVTQLRSGEITTLGDAHAAGDAARRAGNADLVRKAERVRHALARRQRDTAPRRRPRRAP